MRSAYIGAVGPEAARFQWPIAAAAATTTSSDADDEQQSSSLLLPQTGLVPGLTEIRYTPDKGRGVFATQFLPAGTLVWNLRYHAHFFTEASMRRFLTSIREEQACDALQWCYAMNATSTTTTGEGGSAVVACDLDEGSLFNHADDGIANVEDTEDGVDGVVTVRDVFPGEELTQDYLDFELEVEWFENMMEDAWGVVGERSEQVEES